MAKIIVIAYACDPHGGSEGGVGWGMVKSLAENNELLVVVEEEKFSDEIFRFSSHFEY